MQKEFIRAFYSSWGSGVTGTASLPLFVLAFLTSGVPRLVNAVFALVCFLFAAYFVWAKERRCVIELQGGPQVSFPTLAIGSWNDRQWLFEFLNASDDTAVNVTLSPISSNAIVYEFTPISSLVKSPAPKAMEYCGRTISGHPIPTGQGNKDMSWVLALGSNDGTVPYATKLEFSNYGGESRWQVDYILGINSSTRSIAPRAGACRKIT